MSGPEQVEVRVQQAGDDHAGVAAAESMPTMFVRGDRLYVVRQVLDRWATHAGRRQRASAGGADGSGAPGAAGVALADERAETVWRVEASAGREVGAAIYDLICPPATAASGATWTLLCVAD